MTTASAKNKINNNYMFIHARTAVYTISIHTK